MSSDATVTHAGQLPADPTATVGVGSSISSAPAAAVPGYRLDRELGRGGMGVVYLATQDGLNRNVALKMVLSGEHASAAEKGRFLAEAEAVAAVRHPGVVQVFDFGTHDGRPFFALEYLSGGSLADRLKGTPLAAAEAAKVVEAVGRAVQAAHDAGVIHRDLKPANILFDAAGVPKVTDFGLARKGDSGLTVTGAILGTPSYMAPEQAQGRKDVGPAADVYSLGAILYECLTGRPPFKAATPLETIQQVVSDEPVPPSRFTPKLPRDLETVCLKCLSKDPRKRYATAGAMADDLKRFLTGEPTLARPVSAVERGWRWVRRNPLLAAVVFGGPVLLAGTLIVVLIALMTTAIANVQLAAERMKVHNEQLEAERQRELAHARLEKAVEAVDKMMNRVGDERWATNPVLQEERQRVLEDAVAFYAGLTGEDSTDPLVRREAAKAHTRVGGAYLMLSELTKSADATRAAARLYDGLIADFPDDPEYLTAASEVHSLLGNTHALGGKYADARDSYGRAVELADAAIARRPDAESKRRAVEARAALGYFWMQYDRAKGEELLPLMLGMAKEIGDDPAGKFDHRAAYAFALTMAALYDLSAGRVKGAMEKYDTAGRVAEDLATKPAPSVRSREVVTHTRAVVAVQQGTITALGLPVGLDQKRAGAEQMARGIELYDGLLRVNPKAFMYLLQKFIALRGLADVRAQLKETAEAEKLNLAADRILDGMLRDNPNLDWVVGMDAQRQVVRLVERVRSDDSWAFETDADKLIAAARPNVVGVVTYNLACAYAVASARRPANAEKHAKKAVALLNGLIPSGYFRSPARVAHLDDDPDLKPLYGRDDFKAFLARVKNPPADPPKPK